MTLELPEPHFSFSELLHLSYSNVRRRLLRSIITALGVILGIAFMTTLLTSSVILGFMQEQSTVEGYQLWLAGISLLVCFAGITNSMLMAVNERIKEIGVYKCIGGLDSHVVRLFLAEAGILGFGGGVIGSILGIIGGIVLSLNRFTLEEIIPEINERVDVFILLFGFSLTLSIVLTIIATFIPARRAAKLSPSEALRHEA
ncbi:MAG: ABC transporter permease [Candidatus Hodarchaeales archaeon]